MTLPADWSRKVELLVCRKQTSTALWKETRQFLIKNEISFDEIQPFAQQFITQGDANVSGALVRELIIAPYVHRFKRE
ncbi:MAG: hypothetical protein MHM6MM_009488, partial [Cercozoa sp. M6MM]